VPSGVGGFDVSADGTLVYADAPGLTSFGVRTLVWVDRQGREYPTGAPPRQYVYPSLSPDGTRVAVSNTVQEQDIWVFDLVRTTLTRLTLDPAGDGNPIWMPDGQGLLFQSGRSGPNNLYWQAADGTGVAQRLTQSDVEQTPNSVSGDGTRVVFRQLDSAGRPDLMLLPLAGSGVSTESPIRAAGDAQPLLQTAFDENNGVLSPDGRWLAYESNSSGELEVYVRRFPNVAEGQWQVSTTGGRQPLWARNGQELFYLAPDNVLTGVRVNTRGVSWSASAPVRILKEGYVAGAQGRTYDVSPDGQRFLMIKRAVTDANAPPPQIVVVRNWFEELKRLVPTN
jgi:serine/threonine-protein kinase